MIFDRHRFALRKLDWATQKTADFLRAAVNCMAITRDDALQHSTIGQQFRAVTTTRRHGMQQRVDVRFEQGFKACGPRRAPIGKADEQVIKVRLCSCGNAVEIGCRQHALVRLRVVLHHRRIATHLLECQTEETRQDAQFGGYGVDCREKGVVMGWDDAHFRIQGQCLIDVTDGIQGRVRPRIEGSVSWLDLHR